MTRLDGLVPHLSDNVMKQVDKLLLLQVKCFLTGLCPQTHCIVPVDPDAAQLQSVLDSLALDR